MVGADDVRGCVGVIVLRSGVGLDGVTVRLRGVVVVGFVGATVRGFDVERDGVLRSIAVGVRGVTGELFVGAVIVRG